MGVELDKPDGKHDGMVMGRKYFHCRPGHGIFVRPESVRPAVENGSSQAMAVDLTEDVRAWILYAIRHPTLHAHSIEKGAAYVVDL